jgi:uncharacterized protein YccT (UPF0319 family)
VNEKTNQPDTVAVKPAPRTKRDRSAKVTSSPADEIAPEINDEDATRSANVTPDLTLKEVKKVYIDVRGDAALDEIRNNLVKNLESSGVVATTNTDDADAALKITVSHTSTSALLVNARGKVLWTRRYSGETNKIVADIVNDLLSKIR